VGLVVEIQAIVDELVEFDFGEGVEAWTVSTAVATAGTTVAASVSTPVTAAIATGTGPATTTAAGTATTTATTGRTAFTWGAIASTLLLLRFCLFFCHLYI
jgi:hypothetical protein